MLVVNVFCIEFNVLLETVCSKSGACIFFWPAQYPAMCSCRHSDYAGLLSVDIPNTLSCHSSSFELCKKQTETALAQRVR
jgi:hypothetical protein